MYKGEFIFVSGTENELLSNIELMLSFQLFCNSFVRRKNSFWSTDLFIKISKRKKRLLVACLFLDWERSNNEGILFVYRDLIMREFLCLQKDPMSRNRFPQVNLDYNLLTNQSLYNDFNLNQGNQGLSMEVMTLTLSFSTSHNLFTCILVKLWLDSHFFLYYNSIV